MNIIFNYIGTNLLKGIFGVTLFLLGIDLFFYFINELRFVGVGDYDLLAACSFILLTIPRKIYTIAPWAVLIGSLMILGSMAKNNELLFMRSIGFSVNKIALYSSGYILFFTIAIFFLGELLAPKVELFAQKKKTLALSQGNAIYTSLGTWIRNKNKFIHVGVIKDHNTLYNVHIYSLDSKFRMVNATFAASVKLKLDYNCNNMHHECNSLWELSDVTVTDFNYLSKNVDQLPDASDLAAIREIKLKKLPKLQEPNLLDFNILRAANIKHLERLPIFNLAKIIRDRISNNLSVTEYKIAYWKKITQPFLILIMNYLAVTLVISRLKKYSKGTYLLSGLILNIGFYLFNAVLSPLVTVIGLPPIIAVTLPPTICLAIGIYLATRA